MPLTLPTIERMRDVMLSRIQGSPGLTRLSTTEGGLIWQLVNAFAREGRALLVRMMGEWNDWFPTTARGPAQARWAQTLLDPPLIDAVDWTGTITVYSYSNTATVPASTVLVADDGTEYTVTADLTTWTGGSAPYTGTAYASSDGGAAANKANGTTVSFSSPPTSIRTTAYIASTIQYGSDQEDEEGVAQRIATKLADSPGAANCGQYRLWCQEVPDVVNGANRYEIYDAFIYPRWQVAGADAGNFSVWCVIVGPPEDRTFSGAGTVRTVRTSNYDTGKYLRFSPLDDDVNVEVVTGGARSLAVVGTTLTFTVIAGTTTVAEMAADLAADPAGVVLLSLGGSIAGTIPAGYGGSGLIPLSTHEVIAAVEDYLEDKVPVGHTAYVKMPQTVNQSFNLDVRYRPGYEPDWDLDLFASVPLVNSTTGTRQVNTAVSVVGKILPGDRVVLYGSGGVPSQYEVEAVTASDFTVTEDFAVTPAVNSQIHPGGPLWQPIFDALDGHLKTLGPSREDATARAYDRNKRRWPLEEVEAPSTLRLSDLYHLMEGIPGIESVAFTTPGIDVVNTAAEEGVPEIFVLGKAVGSAVQIQWVSLAVP